MMDVVILVFPYFSITFVLQGVSQKNMPRIPIGCMSICLLIPTYVVLIFSKEKLLFNPRNDFIIYLWENLPKNDWYSTITKIIAHLFRCLCLLPLRELLTLLHPQKVINHVLLFISLKTFGALIKSWLVGTKCLSLSTK